MERKAKGTSTFKMKSPLKSYKDKAKEKYKEREKTDMDRIHENLDLENYTKKNTEKAKYPKYGSERGL